MVLEIYNKIVAMNCPLISIIIPIYNVEKYIFTCLESIVSQPLKEDNNIEIIVVNDGTPDNSMSIVNEYVSKYPNIYVYEQFNQGPSIARNMAISKANGDYILFVDSDDWLLPNSLNGIFEIIQKNPSIELFSSPLTMYYSSEGGVENTLV